MSWREDAACIGVEDPEIFFPESGKKDDATAAKNLCRSCPVSEHCLEFAIAHRPRYGIWGGMTIPELRAYKREVVEA